MIDYTSKFDTGLELQLEALKMGFTAGGVDNILEVGLSERCSGRGKAGRFAYLCFNKTVTIIGQHPKDRGCVCYLIEAVGRRRSG